MLLDETIKELKKIMMSITVKYRRRGEALDNKESAYNAGRFISAMEGMDRFISYPYFDVEAVMNAGLASNEQDAADLALNPAKIPAEYRDRLVVEQRKVIIKNYVELNPYYRMLNGEPTLGTTRHYADMSFYEKYDIDVKPVYQFTDLEVITLRNSGELDAIKTRYTEGVEYLDYLGDKRIAPYKARKAHNFQVLRVDYISNNSLIDKFLKIYEQNRSYVMSVLYVKSFSSTKPYYDEFMALLINVMTAQRVVVDVFKTGISRDFYDLEMVKALLESYRVPFIESLPLEYQVLLCKNLNKLLHYKSTDKVIFDLMDLMGFHNANVFKYYLVKNHRMDGDGNPIFEYKVGDDGKLVENVDVMYDLHFKSINLRDDNEEFELSNPRNRIEYKAVADTDPYWWEDDSETLKKLYEEEFNYIDTKYLHLNIMYKITEVLFEIIHIFKILKDKRTQTEHVLIAFDKILPDRRIDLFTLFNFVTASLCKRRKLKGEIITKHTKVLSLVGFDFDADFVTLRKYLESHSDLIKSNEILKYIANTDIASVKDVDRIFNNVKDLWMLLSREMARTSDFKVFKIYQNLYQTLFVSDYMAELFTKSDGTIAYTYLDMLADLDPELFNKVLEADDDRLDDFITYSIDVLESMVNSSKYLDLLIHDSTPMTEALMKLITFFKSYTVDLRGFNIIYVLDHPYLHGVKILDKIQRVSTKMKANDELILQDILKVFSTMTEEQRLLSMEKFHMTSFIKLMEEAFLIDKFRMESSIKTSESISPIDIVKIRSTLKDKMGIRFHEVLKLSSIIRSNEKLTTKDKVRLRSYFNVEDELSFIDVIKGIKEMIKLGEEVKLREVLNITSSIRLSNRIFRDILGPMNSTITIDEKVKLIDVLLMASTIELDEKVLSRDTIAIESKIRHKDELLSDDKLIFESKVYMPDDTLSLMDTVSQSSNIRVKDSIGFKDSIKIVR